MKSGKVSQTALKVALIIVSLAQKDEWRSRLPAGMAALTERLILAADVFGYRAKMVGWSKLPATLALYERGEQRMPGSFEGMGHRKLFINEQVLAAIAAGAKQVLILGAGLDTLCLRLAPLHPEVRFFEVDHPATSEAKLRGVSAEGQPDNMLMIAADLGEVQLSELMRQQPGWDRHTRSVVVAEGLLMYLTEAQVRALFDELAACAELGSRMVFSHLVDLERAGGWARIGLKLIGEPWLSAITRDQLGAYLDNIGWRMIAQDEPRHEQELEGCAVAEIC